MCVCIYTYVCVRVYIYIYTRKVPLPADGTMKCLIIRHAPPAVFILYLCF